MARPTLPPEVRQRLRGARMADVRHPGEDLEVVTETFRCRGAQSRGPDRI